MDLAVRVEAPRSGKNRSALAPLQLAPSCQDRAPPTSSASLRSSSMYLQTTRMSLLRAVRAQRKCNLLKNETSRRQEREISRAERANRALPGPGDRAGDWGLG